MSCCGSRRAALRAQFQSEAPAPLGPPVLPAPVALAPAAEGATLARGAHTGLTYVFAGDGAALEVDGRDAPALLAGGSFVAALPYRVKAV